ncbi:ABC transporter substrate-binding protein [Brachybacterium sp. UMB0905]|uniref:ABC transporter substrate-binding protein n=1 Tax=Brachybacterium sp. UMB0905 TaxID=2069310 RepID=UPI000C7FDD6F|nr:ABC transporter substrate-binding protein [Brachybacterium sp. UMB0905]PMC74527.1 sugar-binding protein [Brachybacterium sp. UMB0905]
MTAFRPHRRSVLGASALAAMGLLAACSTSTTGKSGGSDGGGAGGGQNTMWYWPEGFDEKIISAVQEKFPEAGFSQVIQGGDFKQKLQTTLQAKSGLPAITGIKGEDIAFFKSVPEYFVDLNTLGAEDKKGEYLDWKWEQATTTDGKQLGIPIDIGPTALFYRFDVFEEAGLPADPTELGEAITEWDALFEMGKKLQEKDSETYLLRNLAGVFDYARRQSGKAFIDESGTFIGAEEHVRHAWDLAVSAHEMGINAALDSNTADTAAMVASGKLPADFGASWHLADLIVDAPDTSGKWHVTTHPGEATNQGGSFLGIPEGGTEDPELALEIIFEILSAQNLATEYTHSGNFPANIGSFDTPEVTGEVEFLGGQVASEVFSAAAEHVRPLFEDSRDGTVGAPFWAQLTEVEASGKDPETAWNDAVKEATRLAEQNGVKVD